MGEKTRTKKTYIYSSSGRWTIKKEGKKLLRTSKWSSKAAAHPNSTAHCQDVCVTVWILLIQRGRGGGYSVKTKERQHIDEVYLTPEIFLK